MNLLLVGVGGALGAICRYLLGLAIMSRFPKPPFPIAMLIVNVLGSLGLGLFYGSYYGAIPRRMDETPIDVATRQVGDRVRVIVADHGDGVDDDLKQRMFDPFEQGPTAPSHQPGTGIGLALVREFVQLHGGSVQILDTPDGGATFVIELPTATREDATSPQQDTT
jgi:hypothetical protein